jgi:hypothetical protein
MKYHFDKNFIPSHTLAEQLKALIEKREKAEREQWVDTVPYGSEATAFDELQEAEKQERKR